MNDSLAASLYRFTQGDFFPTSGSEYALLATPTHILASILLIGCEVAVLWMCNRGVKSVKWKVMEGAES